MTSVDKDVQLDSSEAQVRYVTWVVRDNENWNNYGISEEDIGVCFEMSGPLAFDGRHSVARLRRALKEAKRLGLIQVAGSHYFPSVSVNATALRETIDEHGERICARAGCEVRLDARRPNAGDCSTRCRDRDFRRTRQAENRRNNRRSGAPESAVFRSRPGDVAPTPKTAQKRDLVGVSGGGQR